MLVAGRGFEPRLMAPKATVLPLDDPAKNRFPRLAPWYYIFHFATAPNRRILTRELWSEGRDLNPRPSPWQGDVLPLNYPRENTCRGTDSNCRHLLFQSSALPLSYLGLPCIILELLNESPPTLRSGFLLFLRFA